MGVDLGTLLVKIGTDLTDFSGGMDKASSLLGSFGKAAAVGALAAGTALAGVGVAAVKMAADFEGGMKDVQTLLGKGATDKVNQLGDAVKRISMDTGKDLTNVAGGLYEVISAFGDTADAATQLEIATKAAMGGKAETIDAVKLLSGVTKGYGDTSSAAVQKVADLAFQTANLGQTTFPELAATMGRVTPLAATMGIKMEELFGSMATLTGVTGNTAEVTTQMRATIQALLNPSKDMATAMSNLGFTSGQAMVKSLGLQGTLQKLADSTGGNTAQLAQMFGSVEGLNAVLALTGNQAQDFTDKTKAMYDATGASTQAFEIQQQSVNAMMGRLKETGSVMMVELGEKFLPVLMKLAQWVMDNMPAIQGFFEGAFNVIGELVKGLGVVFNWLKDTVWTPLVEGFKTGSTDMQGPFSEWAASIGNTIAGVVEFFTNFKENVWKPLVEGWTTGNTDMSTSTGTTFALIGDILHQAWDVISKVVEAVMLLWNEWGDEIMAVVGVAFNTILTVIDGVLKALGGVLDVFIGLFTGNWGRMGDGLLAIWGGLWKAVDAILGGLWAILVITLGGLWDSMKKWFIDLATDAYQWGIDMMQGFINGITSMMAHIWQKVTDFINSVVDAVKGALDINSPSKVFRDIGANIGKGLALGIEGTEVNVNRAMQMVLPNVRAASVGSSTNVAAASGAQQVVIPVYLYENGPKMGEYIRDAVFGDLRQAKRAMG